MNFRFLIGYNELIRMLKLIGDAVKVKTNIGKNNASFNVPPVIIKFGISELNIPPVTVGGSIPDGWILIPQSQLEELLVILKKIKIKFR